MKYIFLTIIFAFVSAFACAADAGDDIKKLVLKYDAAAPAAKPAVRKEIEKLALEQETEAAQKTDERLKRQEAKLKELKKAQEERKKNIKQTAAKNAANLLSKESIEKIKSETPAQKITDKVKSKK